MNGGMNVLDHFSFLVASQPLRWAAAIALTLLLFGVVAAHWPVAFPGPLTEDEREAARSRGLRRWLTAAGPLLALSAFLGVAMLVFPPRQPVALSLVSRARTTSVEYAPDRITRPGLRDRGQREPGKAPPGCELPEGDVYDVGGAADAWARNLGAEHPWAVAGPDEVALARRRLAEIASRIDLRLSPTTLGSTAMPPAPDSLSALPVWLRESVEISAVQAALRNHPVKQVFVAPGPARDLSSWRILAAIAEAAGVAFCLVDEPAIHGGDALSVLRLAQARVRDDGTLTFFALVDGRTGPKGDPKNEVSFTAIMGRTRQTFRMRVPAGDGQSRLVRYCIGPKCGPGETSRSAPDDLRALIDASLQGAGTLVLATDNPPGGPEHAARVTPLAQVEKVPHLHLIGAAAQHATAWSMLLSPDTWPFRREKEALVADVEAHGWKIPTISSRSESEPVAYLAESDGRLIIAGSADAAQRGAAAAALARSPSLPPGARLRVVSSSIGNRTAFSWASTTPPGQVTTARLLRPANAAVTLGLPRQPSPEEGHEHDPVAGFVEVGDPEGKGRYVAIAVDMASPQILTDPLLGLPLVRTVAWAAQWVTNDVEEEDLRSAEPSGVNERGGPLLDDANLQGLQAASLHSMDIVAATALGLYLLHASWQRSRQARATSQRYSRL